MSFLGTAAKIGTFGLVGGSLLGKKGTPDMSVADPAGNMAGLTPGQRAARYGAASSALTRDPTAL